MKNDYNKKKRIVIITLSVLAVCLAGGLFWYMGTLGNTQPPVSQAEVQTEQESVVPVPDIRPERIAKPSTFSSEMTAEAETMSEPETVPEPKTTQVPERSTAAGTGEVQAKPSESKTISPTEATPPAEPPKDKIDSSVPIANPDANGQCQPEHTPQPETNQPQGGEKQNGQIYVPGFGWIEDEGGGSDVQEAPNAGTGKPVGEM